MFNVVTASDPAEVAEVLTGSPDVDMISFTGSSAVGKRITERGAGNLKRVFLELGGKSANIVLDDAKFPDALAGASMVCMHSGQGCAITTRLLLPRSRYDEGVEIVKAGFESFAYGDPNEFENMAGPLINARQRERVLGYIEKGKQEGARCLVGGGPATQFEKGYFVQPTLFVDVDPNSTIAQEEIFGPVLVGHPLRRRRRCGAHRQQLALRVVGRGHLEVARPGARRGPPHPHGHRRRQRRPVVRARLTLRGLPGVGQRPGARRGGLRGVPRDQDHRPAGLSPEAAHNPRNF